MFRLMIVLAFAASWFLLDAPSHGQTNAVPAGSAEAKRRVQEQQDQIAAMVAEQKKARETGRTLFGSSSHFGDKDYGGTLISKNPPAYDVGDWGFTGQILQAISKVSATEYLVLPTWKDSPVLLLRGLDMAKVRDGARFIVEHPAVIQEIFTYKTVLGATKTVLVLDFDKDATDARAEEVKNRRAQEAAAAAERATETAKKAAAKAAERTEAALIEMGKRAEATAAAKLNIAKMLSSTEARMRKLREIVAMFPDTRAAEEARDMLRRMER